MKIYRLLHENLQLRLSTLWDLDGNCFGPIGLHAVFVATMI